MFSIVIPTYNNIDLFKRALNSVLKQSNQDFEIIISDDSNNSIIEEYCLSLNRSNIRYFRNMHKSSIIANWNNGLSKIKGDIVIVMHHDEEFKSPEHLHLLQNKMQDTDLIISNIEVINDTSVKKDWIPKPIKNILNIIPEIILLINIIGPCACIAFKRELLEYFDENLVWLVDTEWYYRIISNSRSCTILYNDYISSNDGHDGQITSNIDVKNQNKKDIEYLFCKYHNKPSIWLTLILKKFLYYLKK